MELYACHLIYWAWNARFMTGEEEGSGVMPMYTRLVPAAARSGAQSDCSTSSPIFTGLARLLDYISRVRFAHRRSS